MNVYKVILLFTNKNKGYILKLGYGRVSTKDQHEERQKKALMELGIEERFIFIDKASGRNFNREKYALVNVLPPIEAGASCFSENSTTDSEELRRLTFSSQA